MTMIAEGCFRHWIGQHNAYLILL